MGRRKGHSGVVKMRGMPRGGGGQIDMSVFNKMTAGMSDEQRKMIMGQAMQAAHNPNALKIAQKVAKKGGKRRKNGKLKMRAKDALDIKDELINNPDIMRDFGFDPTNNIPGFPSVPAEVRAAFEGESHKCDQCQQQGNCLHDGETNSWLCSQKCQQIMRSKIGIKDNEHLCHNPSCDKDGINRCASCNRAFYCSRECQKNHWKSHKKLCKMVKKAENQKKAALDAQQQANRAERIQRQQKENLFQCKTDPSDNIAIDAFIADIEEDDDTELLLSPTLAQTNYRDAFDQVCQDLKIVKTNHQVNDDEEVDIDDILSTIQNK